MMPKTSSEGKLADAAQTAQQGVSALADKLIGQGMHINEVCRRVYDFNRDLPQPLDDRQLLGLLAARRGGSGAAKAPPNNRLERSVNQETQETQSKQENQPSSKEQQRETSRPSSKEQQRETSSGVASTPQPRSRQELFQEELRSGLPSSLPFEAYLPLAVDEYERHEREDEQAGWTTPLFYFVRLIKAHPTAGKASVQAVLAEIERVMVGWRHGLSREKRALHDAWLAWLEVSREDAHAEFFGAWEKVRYLPGRSPLANALEQAERFPSFGLRPEVKAKRPPGYERFISLAGWLQVGMGNSYILLPVEEVAEVLEVKTATVSRYRRWAVEDGYLKEVEGYERPGKGHKGKATVFRFDVTKFETLQERAQQGTAQSFTRLSSTEAAGAASGPEGTP
jgi:hypothetical protein